MMWSWHKITSDPVRFVMTKIHLLHLLTRRVKSNETNNLLHKIQLWSHDPLVEYIPEQWPSLKWIMARILSMSVFRPWWCELLFDQYHGRGLTLDNIFITPWLESGQGVDIAFKIRTKSYIFVLSLFVEPERILSTNITLSPRLWNPSSETTVPYFSNTLNTCNSKAADVIVTHEAIRHQQPLYSPNSP